MRVLYVDDDADIREIAIMSLGLHPSIETRSAASGKEALRIAHEWQPDLILLDVMMPEMDGPSVLAQLRQAPATDRIPVVFMTARTQPQEVRHFIGLGAEGVIAKPFDPMTLADDVRNYANGPGRAG